MFSFLAILLNCTDWAITGRIACAQFNSTLEHKEKTRALQGIFLVRKWINNTLKSNSVRYHMHHWKNLSFLSSFGLRTVFVKGSKIAVFVSIVTSKRVRWPPLFITFLSSSRLVTSVYQVSGADPGFFLGGGALVSCSTSTPINHIVCFFFRRVPVVLENRWSSQGGVRTPCTLPLDPHLSFISNLC